VVDPHLTSGTLSYSEVNSEGERIHKHSKKIKPVKDPDAVEISDSDGEDDETLNHSVTEEKKSKKGKKLKPFNMQKLEQLAISTKINHFKVGLKKDDFKELRERKFVI